MGKKFFCMTLFVLPMFSAAPVLFAQSGIYFDVGVGFGQSWTALDGKDVSQSLKDSRYNVSEVGVDLGLKLGYGPFGNVPIYVVGNVGGTGHRFYDNSGAIQFNTYMLGGGVVYYPIPLIHISADLGYSFVANDIGYKIPAAKSLKGIAWDASIGLDFGKSNNGFLILFTYFGAVNTLETGANESNSFVGIFFKYAYRHKHQKESEAAF